MDPGTIDPSALNPASANTASSSSNNPTPNLRLESTTSRGIKRSRSDDEPGDTVAGGQGNDHDDAKPRKRGRPSRSTGPESPSPTARNHQTSQPIATPQPAPLALAHASPPQVSPPKSTPTKALKALPTVRDHTYDTLNPEGDEYQIRDTDEAGERKVTATGHLTEGRKYRCRTFLVPNRGDKLFMLATECARVLHYRDSYLLFNKNRSLHKIIASPTEKEDLIHQEILPFSYRSRQIAIVSARSMYRQFGAKIIEGGRRVRDDYWEAKAKKQGFTEDDLATEKRPGGNTQKKEPTTQTETPHAVTLSALATQREQITYVNPQSPNNPYQLAPAPVIDGLAPSPGLPMIEYGNPQRPRQDITGTPYQDRTSSSNPSEIVNQASQIAEFSRNLNSTSAMRGQFLNDTWHREHLPSQPSQLGEDEPQISAPSGLSSPQPARNHPLPMSNQPALMQQPHSTPSHMIAASGDMQHQTPPQPNYLSQSPVHARMPPQMQQSQMHQRQPSYPYGMNPMGGQNQMFSYPQQNQMWPQQPQTPMAPHHQMSYGHQQPQQSPGPQQSPQQHNFMHPQMMQQHANPMAYQSMPGMPGMPYPGVPRAMVQQSPNPQQYMQSSGVSQPGMPGWAPQAPGGAGGHTSQQQQGWPNF